MGVAREDVDRWTAALAPLGDITTKPMMGGAMLYRDGTLFGWVDPEGELTLKVAGGFAGRLVDAGGGPAILRFKGRESESRNYYHLPPDADPVAWASEALSHLD